jgi:hypothetical protein
MALNEEPAEDTEELDCVLTVGGRRREPEGEGLGTRHPFVSPYVDKGFGSIYIVGSVRRDRGEYCGLGWNIQLEEVLCVLLNKETSVGLGWHP